MIMKKIVYITLAFAALLTACSKAEQPETKVQPHHVELTLTTEQAATKTTITKDGSTYSRVWKKGDRVSVLYSTGDPAVAHNECFTLIDGAGTTTGTFGCDESELSGSLNVRVIYPYTTAEYNDSWWSRSIETQAYGYLDYLGDYDMMFGSGTYDGSAFSVAKLSPQVFYLHFPAGLQLVGNSAGSATVTLSLTGMAGTTVNNEFINNKTLNSANTNEGAINVTDVQLTDGCLVSDIYMAVNTDTNPNESFNLTVADATHNCLYIFSRGAGNYLYKGTIYHLSQSKFSPVATW